MIISAKNNKFYAKFIDDFRLSFFPWYDNKVFRDHVKSLNPNYPRDSTTGKHVSFAKIDMPEYMKHLQFLKTLACKYNMSSDYISENDRYVASTSWFKASIHKIVEGGGDFNVVEVICSRCGSCTKRALSRARMQELMDIDEGKKKESTSAIGETFLCVNCVTLKIGERDEAREPGR